MHHLLAVALCFFICFTQETLHAAKAPKAPKADPPKSNLGRKKSGPVVKVTPSVIETLVAINVTGNRKIEKDAILLKLQSKVGENYSADKVREDVLALVRLGYFINVEVDRELNGNNVTLNFKVLEKPSIIEIKVEGSGELKQEEVLDASGLKAYEIYNQTRVNEGVEKIQKFYEDKGYFLAKVKPKVEVIKADETVKLTFEITENEKVKVKKITFLGNSKLSDNALKTAIATKEGGFFSSLSGSGQYKQEAFDRDLQIIRFSYYNRGFVQAKVDRPQVYVTPDKKSIYITIRIEEGDQYSVGEVDFAGDLLFSKEELFSSIQINKNGVFAYDVLHKDISELTAKYGDLGYAYANVIPRTRVDDVAKKMDVVFEFDKGSKVYFGKINVVGNSKTRDKVVRRELKIREGELYNETARRKSVEGVQRLGFFEEVNFKSATDPDRLDVMNLDILVKERNTGQISLAASYGTATGFGLQGSIQEINFLGRGQNLGASLSVTDKTNEASISFTEPYFRDTEWTTGFEVYKKLNTIRTSYDEDRFGGAVTLGHPFAEDTRYSVRLKTENTRLSEKSIRLPSGDISYTDPALFPVRDASGNTNSAMGTISYDTRNDRFSPSKGIFSSISYEYGGIGGSVRYQRFNGAFRFFRNIFWDVVWRNSLSYGHIESLDAKDPPFTELYLLGGPYSLRGYRMYTVGRRKFSDYLYNKYQTAYPNRSDLWTQNANQPFGGVQQALYQTEFQFPLIKEASMFGVVFFDSGIAEDQLSANRLYSDWGFGLRWFSPIGPLRFEMGFPLTFDDINRESGIFEFSIGTPF